MPLQINNFSNPILKNISFNIKHGNHLIILGANGVGKTTLGKILTGIVPSKSVRVDGALLSSFLGDERRKKINYIPSKLEIFDSFMSVKDFLSLSTLHSNLSIDEALSQVQLGHLSHQRCQTLSSGESQLLLMASALLHHAHYTIFDEPTANLDPQKMQMVFQILKYSLSNESKILITHNLDLAYKLGFDILFLEEGKIAFHGASEVFFENANLNKRYEGTVIKESHGIRIKL